MKAAGPIAGKWVPPCAEAFGMVITITVDAPGKATGKVTDPGLAAQIGYSAGEDILRLNSDDFGDWSGMLHWRSVLGAERWDPIRLVATADSLSASMTTDSCYVHMTRAK
jgi:hypothetical protein